MKRDARFTIPVATRRNIIRLFKSQSNNTSPAIAEKLGISKRTVNTVLDGYLNRKIKKHQNKNG